MQHQIRFALHTMALEAGQKVRRLCLLVTPHLFFQGLPRHLPHSLADSFLFPFCKGSSVVRSQGLGRREQTVFAGSPGARESPRGVSVDGSSSFRLERLGSLRSSPHFGPRSR